MEQKYVTDLQGNKVLPITHVDAVRDDEGNSLPSILGAFEDEVRGLVDTPHQEYVTVAASSQTTAAEDVLPASGQSADTIYRVSSWDGSANSGAGGYDVTKYSEYAWDDVSNPNKYVFLCVKSQIDEVFDISVYNNNAKYANLSAALGTNGANVPESVRKGGMSVKYVHSSDNKYVQYRFMLSTFTAAQFVNPANWQGVDDEPTAGSDNLVKSGGVEKYLAKIVVAKVDEPTSEKGGMSDVGIFDPDSSYRIVRPVALNPGETFIVNQGEQVYIGSETSLLFECDSAGNFVRSIIDRSSAGGEFYITGASYTNTGSSIMYVGTCTANNAGTKYMITKIDVAAAYNDLNDVKEDLLPVKTAVDNKKDSAIPDSTDLITSGGVEATLYHHYGTKDLSVTTSRQIILLREFDYGHKIAVRIVSNTAIYANNVVKFQVEYSDGTSSAVLSARDYWVVVTVEDKTINRIKVYCEGSVTTAGTITIEVIFKDAFDAIIKDVLPDPLSENAIIGKGVYPFAKAAFKHRIGKNLCNPKDPGFVLGKLYVNGIMYDYANFGITGFIPVSANGLVCANISDSYGFTVFDSAYQYIRTVNNTSGVYTYAEGDAYVRCNFSIANKDVIQVEEGSTATDFEEYNPVYEQMEEVKEWAKTKLDNKPDLPISPDDISFIHRYNLFNKDTGRDYEDGVTTVDIDDNIWNCYLYNNTLTGNASLSVTAYLPVDGKEFYAHKIGGKNVMWIAYYTKNKTYISTETVSEATAVFTPPQNAYYARITFYTSDKALFMVTHDTNPSEFVPYDKFVVDDIFIKGDEDKPSVEAIIPSRVYALLGEQNSIYHNEYINCYNPYAVYIQKYGGSWKYHERCWRRESDAGNATLLSFIIKDRLTGDVIQNVSATTVSAAKTAGSSAIKVSCIGDSFCYGGYYIKQIVDLCEDVTMVGMRLSNNTSVPCEGRGGWKLSDYMNPKCGDIALSHMQPFSPFMHADGYTYYGVMEFWASIVNGTSQYPYGTNGFSAYTSWFDTNGRKANPSVNDLMYNQTAEKFEYYDGSAWVQLDTEPEFEFNYAKYIQTWQIDSPDFVVLQLGTNDFFDNDEVFDTWKSNMDVVIDSINAYATSQSKTIKIVVCTVLTISGLSYNNYGDGYIERSRIYWEMRKKTIQAFDNDTYRNTKHVYIADTGTSVDNKYGFYVRDEKPFAYYEGDETEPYNWNGVHPNEAGYKQFGTCIAAAIQCLRD